MANGQFGRPLGIAVRPVGEAYKPGTAHAQSQLHSMVAAIVMELKQSRGLVLLKNVQVFKAI